jgi:hypothetical protein
MASIKLKGDTSGEVIISAPSVAGNTTLELPATSSTLATQNSLGLRNLIINGDMRIAQRGTSSTGVTGNGYYTVDRFDVGGGTLGTWTMSQDTDVPSGQGFSKSIKWQCTTANTSLSATSFFDMHQSLEGQNLQHLKYGTSNAESLTLSFWVKSNKTGTYQYNLYSSDNSGKAVNGSFTINVSNTWEKKTITYNGDTVDSLDNDNGRSLDIQLIMVAGSDYTGGTSSSSWTTWTNSQRAPDLTVNLADSTSNYINITGVQLEVGTTATPFEHKPYDMELARCQRYYQRFKGGGAFTSGIVGCYNGTTQLIGLHHHIVPMRASPTFGFSALSHFDLEPFDAQPTALSGNGTGNLYQASVTATDPTARVRGYGGTITCDNAAGYFDFSAEL